MIPSSFVQELLARADIAAVVGRHVELKKAGVNLKGLCPFHGEKTPSFVVSPSRQTYHCFGCGAHGNAIGFLIEHVGLGFVEAVRDLAADIGLQVPQDERSDADREQARAARERQATLTEVLARAGAHWRRQLKNSDRAIAYLKRRGLSGEIAARFGLGYASDSWRGLASAFARYDDPLLEEAGLVLVQSDTGGDEARRYDRFRDRVMFPIRNVQGQVIGFGGRVIDAGPARPDGPADAPANPAALQPKYLNSPETPVFVKGRELYGLYEARQALRECGCALVVEGYMDVVALAQLGFPNAVATLGTACTADHVAKLFRFTDHIVFSFDGDAAGRRAAARALEAALPLATDTRSVRFLFLPSEHDPDSFVRERGAEAFEQAIAAAVPLSRQLVEQASAGCELSTAEGRARMLAQSKALVTLMPNGLLRQQLIQQLAALGGVTADVLADAWRGTAPARERRAARPLAGGSGSPRRARPAVATLLDRAAWLVLHDAKLWFDLGAEAQERLVGAPPPHGELFAWIERFVHDHGALPAESLLEALRADPSTDPLRPLVDRIEQFHDVVSAADARADLALLMERLHLQAVDDEIALLIESGELSEAATARRDELIALRSRIRSPRPQSV